MENIIDLSKFPEEVRERIIKYIKENDSIYKNIGDKYVVFRQSYYGGDYWYGSPMSTEIRAYYKNPEDKTSGVIEFKHYFHAVEIGKIQEKDVITIKE